MHLATLPLLYGMLASAVPAFAQEPVEADVDDLPE